jgi:hypothetical protein
MKIFKLAISELIIATILGLACYAVYRIGLDDLTKVPMSVLHWISISFIIKLLLPFDFMSRLDKKQKDSSETNSNITNFFKKNTNER